MPNAAQINFDKLYITSAEIASEVGVTRPAVLYARQRGTLPDAISVGEERIYIWVRETVRPYIDAWKREREQTKS